MIDATTLAGVRSLLEDQDPHHTLIALHIVSEAADTMPTMPADLVLDFCHVMVATLAAAERDLGLSPEHREHFVRAMMGAFARVQAVPS